MNIILIILAGLLTGWVATILFEFILKTNKELRAKYYRHHEILFGYHVHHSAYGLIFIIIGIIFYLKNNFPDSLFYIALGIGIILQHTISDRRFVFIEKQRL
ncbi:MAG: hypothetical protein ABSF55_00755 [Candidatus Staskawiczbacteria bacterium]|jgi:hypothetical protein